MHFRLTGLDTAALFYRKYQQMYLFCCIQTSKTGGQSYRDTISVGRHQWYRMYASQTDSKSRFLLLLKNWPFPASFTLFLSFLHLWSINVHCKILPMAGFKPCTSGIGRDHSANWATTTAVVYLLFATNNSNPEFEACFVRCSIV